MRYVTADEAVRAVQSGNHIHLSSIASVPHVLIEAICRRADSGGEIEDLHFIIFIQKDLHLTVHLSIQGSSLTKASSWGQM